MPLEIQMLQRVQQVPGVVKMYEFFELADFFVIIMEKPESVTVRLDRTLALELRSVPVFEHSTFPSAGPLRLHLREEAAERTGGGRVPAGDRADHSQLPRARRPPSRPEGREPPRRQRTPRPAGAALRAPVVCATSHADFAPSAPYRLRLRRHRSSRPSRQFHGL